MKVAVVLESFDDDFEQLEKLVYSYDPSMVIQRFKTVDTFAKWFAELAQKPPEDRFTLAILISSYQILGAKHISLFQKINSFMKERGYLDEETKRLPLLIAARDTEEFDRTPFQLPIFDNIVFKPVDLAVDLGKMDWAIRGVEAMSSEETAKQKPVAPLEMLKDVRIDRLTEIGFRSLSMKPIPIGRLAKYYIPSLKPLGSDYGVYATCTLCVPVGEENNKFACSFSFFGLTQEKAKNIRNVIDASENSTKMDFVQQISEVPVGVVAIVEESDLSQRLEGALDAAFENLELKKFDNFMDFYSEIDASMAAKSWAGQFANQTSAILEFDLSSGVFQRAFKKGDEKSPLMDYLGLNYDQMKRFKTLCLTNCRTELRKNLGLYWSRSVATQLPLVIRDNKMTYFLTLASSEEIETPGGKKIQIEIRAATPDEVIEIKKYDKQLPHDLRVVITTERIAQLRPKEFWDELRAKVNPRRPAHEVPFIVIGKTNLKLFEQAERMDCFTDYLVEPFDQMFLKKKINYLVPSVRVRDGVAQRACLPTDEIIKAGKQVEIKNFSEVSLSVEYHRVLPESTFREFVIYIEQERMFEEILAKAVGAEKDENRKDVMINHFTLFGHGDKTNQRIRQWLNEQYVLSKKDEE